VATPHRQLGQHLLQLGYVAGHEGDQVVHLAGNQVGGDDLWHRAQHLLERAAGPRVVLGERGRDVGLEREARGRRVQPGVDHPDDAGLLEMADPVQRRRR
jgi:hypothetical protein